MRDFRKETIYGEEGHPEVQELIGVSAAIINTSVLPHLFQDYDSNELLIDPRESSLTTFPYLPKWVIAPDRETSIVKCTVFTFIPVWVLLNEGEVGQMPWANKTYATQHRLKAETWIRDRDYPFIQQDLQSPDILCGQSPEAIVEILEEINCHQVWNRSPRVNIPSPSFYDAI